MSGPRDLRRGAVKPYEPRASIQAVVGRKSHYIVEQWGNGYAVNVHRFGKGVETIMCSSPGELHRVKARLSGEGLIGVVGGAV